MSKKKLLIILSILAILLIFSLIYWITSINPSSFPDKEELMEEINHIFPPANVKEIQDTIVLDEKHVFVPFISEENNYGVSHWVWEQRKWELARVNTGGEPHSWRIENEDLSTTHLVWNISPEIPIEKLKFYLIKDRSFHITDGIDYYDPGVQLEEIVELSDTSYGAMPLPDSWSSILASYTKLETARQPDIFSNFFIEQYMYLGWMAYDYSGKVLPTVNALNGSGFTGGDEHIEHIRLLDKLEIEAAD
ncbi:hypothetical protein M9R32_07950 [Paenisporosarcina quisquiliarum]|uniref:Uncharacterized protein n=1 Tax=Paenisporosarcina quisquiliarum TaxID=365346 RepID=A0A9X3RE41_9BACL|nr:hypothetical protein [Paenisporosarcina quisquiliarum]MCZ8537107.1 hypothetical protein [Paenisporosarcina quisquiliarum]